MSNAALLWTIWGATQLLALWFFFGLWPWLLNRWHARTGEKPGRGLAVACAILGWVQVAQYLLVTLDGARFPGLFGPTVPASALLFPLSLATLLGLYAVLPTVSRGSLFFRIARVLLLINGALVAGTFVARNLELEAALAEGAELWSAAATKKVGFGALIFVLDLIVMVALFRFAGRRGWGRFRQIAVPLLLALAVDAVLFGIVLAALDPSAAFGATVGDQLLCKLPVGLVYAACVVGYLSAYVPGAFGPAGIGLTPRGSEADSRGRVFVRVACAAGLAVLVALRLTEWPGSGTPGRSAPKQGGVMDDTVEPGAPAAPQPAPNDLPPVANEEQVLAAFRAELRASGGGPVGVIGADPVLPDLPPIPNEDELLAEFRAELARAHPT